MPTPLSEVAAGRWKGILPQFGIGKDYLTGKHGPCPLCGEGKDRWRFDNKHGHGTWICSKCGAGDGVTLVMRKTGLDFPEAARKIKIAMGAALVEPFRRDTITEQRRREILNALWRQTHPIRPGDPVDNYLLARGLVARPAVLRTIDRLRYNAPSPSWHPAMVAMVTAPDGHPATLHRTYLGVGRKAEVDAPRRVMPGGIPRGSAVRLADPVDGQLGVAEGIETAIAAAVIHGVPVWAAINASMLASWEPPPDVAHILIFGDNDEGYAGQAAAYVLARRLSSTSRKVAVQIPPEVGTDWNDYLKCPHVRAQMDRRPRHDAPGGGISSAAQHPDLLPHPQ